MNKIAFFSTSSRPVKSLQELSSKFNICLVVTKSDRLIGKNKEKTPNEVKKFAVEHNIPVFEIDKMDSETKIKLEQKLTDAQNELIGNSLMLDEVWKYHPANSEFVNPIKVYDDLKKSIESLELKIRLYETERNFVDYPA